VSAIFGPDGQTLDELPTFEPGVMVASVPLRTSLTPAMAVGSGLDLAINLMALLLILLTVDRKTLMLLKPGKKKAPSKG
jgi:apolipoprotein N-acyltransferase